MSEARAANRVSRQRELLASDLLSLKKTAWLVDIMNMTKIGSRLWKILLH